MILRPLLLFAILLAPRVVSAQSAPLVAVFVDVSRGKTAQAAKEAIGAISSSETRVILRGADLKKRLRGNVTRQFRRCKQKASCLAGLGKKVGANFVLLVTVGKSEAVLVMVSVADATELDNSTVAPVRRDAIAGNAEAMIATAVASAPAQRESAEDIAAAELAAAVKAADLPADTNGDAAQATAAPLDAVDGLPLEPLVDAPAVSSEQPMAVMAKSSSEILGYPMTWRTWAGAGGVMLGVTGFIVGKSLRGRADTLRELPLRATQIEVVEQEKSQNRAAIGSTVSYLLGATFMTAGVAMVAWDVLDGWTVMAAPSPEGGMAVGVLTEW